MGGSDLKGQEIIFVYNADSGIFHTVGDYIHKIVAPATYPCKLCAITYDSRGMKKDWNTFVKNQDIPVTFLHKDEFSERYPETKEEFPSAFIKEGEKLKPFISAAEINRCETLEVLKGLVDLKIKELHKEQDVGSG